ncbi:hypothetical protein [Sphingomonas sp.]|uniref:hypothetical protein n=1 Tax=Sphingomonas sp. TaxID=28214 RepID=UPI001EBCECAF|nr:hypothetical protein [Sphingomonas sp.]MBX3592909.1 hypothetical protein [Sphingomonas sp.]
MLRRLVLAHPRLAAALLALTLAMKLAVPAGFMPVAGNGTLVLAVCSQMGPQRIVIEVPGLPAQPDDAGRKEQPCAFAGFAHALASGADPFLLAGAIAFILTLGFMAAPLPPRRRARHAWPPLRGPPAIA